MAYRRVQVGSEVIAGESVVAVLCPDSGRPFWLIFLKDGSVYNTTHPVTVVTMHRVAAEKGEEKCPS